MDVIQVRWREGGEGKGRGRVRSDPRLGVGELRARRDIKGTTAGGRYGDYEGHDRELGESQKLDGRNNSVCPPVRLHVVQGTFISPLPFRSCCRRTEEGSRSDDPKFRLRTREMRPDRGGCGWKGLCWTGWRKKRKWACACEVCVSFLGDPTTRFGSTRTRLK
jgi:hypothetical protein